MIGQLAEPWNDRIIFAQFIENRESASRKCGRLGLLFVEGEAGGGREEVRIRSAKKSANPLRRFEGQNLGIEHYGKVLVAGCKPRNELFAKVVGSLLAE